MLQPGDKVALLNEATQGIVISVISSKKIIVATTDGFENTYLVSEIVKILPETKKLESINKVPLKDVAARNNYAKKPNSGPKGMEIDLHIEELANDWKSLTNGQIVQIQLKHLKNCIHLALKQKLTKVVIIHGKGEGVLRAEVRTWLDGVENSEYYDASYQEYGFGATELKIWYK